MGGGGSHGGQVAGKALHVAGSAAMGFVGFPSLTAQAVQSEGGGKTAQDVGLAADAVDIAIRQGGGDGLSARGDLGRCRQGEADGGPGIGIGDELGQEPLVNSRPGGHRMGVEAGTKPSR